MSTAAIDYDALARQYGGTPVASASAQGGGGRASEIDYDAIAAQHGGKPAAPSLDANPQGQGTYPMWDTAGKLHAIPYSLVPVAHGQGYQFDTNPIKDAANAGRNGLTPSQAFLKDEAADPNRVGGTGMAMAPEGAQWSAPAEPASRQESLQRLGDAETNAGLPMRVLTGAMKGAATMARPVVDAMNLGAGGNTPAEQSYMLEGRTPAETAAKVGTMGAMMAPAAVEAPVATALGLAGGTAAGYAGTAAANALGADPRTSAVVGDVTGLAGGVAAGAGLPQMMPEAVRNGTFPSAWDWAKNAPRAVMAGDVNAPIPGLESELTPAQRYASMRNMGMQPSAAEATNSTPLNIAQRVNENSLTAARTYADARAANVKALNDYTDHTLDALSPVSPEEGGAAVQKGLLGAHADLKAATTDAYRGLDAQLGDTPLAGAKGLRELAQQILEQNAPYYKAHPELEPTKAMAIVRDLAGAKGSPRTGPAVIPGFGPAPAAAEPAAAPLLTYSELHRLRSDLLDFNNTNPDLVKNQANGWISQLAGAADHAITNSEGALSPDQVERFRNANEAWKFMKDTFDNPSHPFYQAVRTPSPSTLVNGTSGIARTPEMAQSLVNALGADGIGPVQRGVVESLLKTTKEGGYNFKTFQGQWNKLKPGVRDALFTPEQQQHFQDIGNAGTLLHEEINPSGTAKLGQGQAEMGAGGVAVGGALMAHPAPLAATVAYHAGQYGLGRLMNSPTFVDWLMRGRGFEPVGGGSPGSLPEAQALAAGAGAPVARGPHTGPDGQPNFYSDAYLKSKAAFDAARGQNE